MSETVTVAVTEPVWGQHAGEIKLRIHDAAKCEGYACPFHNPSDHHMRDWPMLVRLDNRALVERTCEHGVGHPDPDSAAYFARWGDEMVGVHGCDGCCGVPPA